MIDRPRPQAFCALLKAVDCRPPRERARDQQADLVGNALKARLLDYVIAKDPEPEAFAGVLLEGARGMGDQAGPARGVASDILLSWEEARVPGFVAWLEQAALEGIGRDAG
jgi:hypothetical protein